MSCYADGMRKVKIPFSSLEKYLDPSGVLGNHARPEPVKPEMSLEPRAPEMELTDDMIIIDDVRLRKNRPAA